MNTDDLAIAKAKSMNALHAAHDGLTVNGKFPDGTPRVACTCGVELKPFDAAAHADLDRSEARTPTPVLIRDSSKRIFVKDDVKK